MVLKKTAHTIFDELNGEEHREDTKEQFNQNNTELKIQDDIREMIKELKEQQKHLDKKLTQTLKENSLFQQQVRTNMAKDIETLQKELLGERMDPILKSLSVIYIEYQELFKNVEDETIKINIHHLFESLVEILEEYGCILQTSQVGDKRSPHLSKIRKVIDTSDPNLHNTVAYSYNPSISKGRKVLYYEFIDTYRYKQQKEIIIENFKGEDANE